jgi:hypothetical protein
MIKAKHRKLIRLRLCLSLTFLFVQQTSSLAGLAATENVTQPSVINSIEAQAEDLLPQNLSTTEKELFNKLFLAN